MLKHVQFGLLEEKRDAIGDLKNFLGTGGGVCMRFEMKIDPVSEYQDKKFIEQDSNSKIWICKSIPRYEGGLPTRGMSAHTQQTTGI